MTSSGKIRIYELSKDLNLDNKDVLDAAKNLAIAAKSHSSSISSLEAKKIKDFLKKSNTNTAKASNKPIQKLDKEIVSLKKNPPKSQKSQKTELKQKPPIQSNHSPSNSNVPLKPNQTLVKTKESVITNDKTNLKNKTPEQITAPSKPSKPLPPKPRKEVKPTISKLVPKAEKETPLSEHQKDAKFNNQPKNVESAQKPINQLKPTYSQEPKRPLPPPSRPQINTQNKKQPQLNSQKPKTRLNPGNLPPQKGVPGNPQRFKNQNTQNQPSRKPQPPTKSNTLELVGAPIRREKPTNTNQSNEARNKPLIPSKPGAPKPPVPTNRQGLSNRPGSNNRGVAGQSRPVSQNRQSPNRVGAGNRPVQGQNRPGGNNRAGTGPSRPGSQNRGGGQNRPGMPTRTVGGPIRSNNRPGVPSGMRKPVAPSELMQLQKPQARPSSPQRKSD